MDESARILESEVNPQAKWPTNYIIDKVSGCWIFQGNHAVYGRAKHQGKLHYAHRLFYRLHVGPIPKGMTIDHVAARGCASKLCVNPDHLEAVSNAENARRGKVKEFCIRGHAMADSRPYQRTRCRECKAIHNTVALRRKREARAARAAA